MQILSARWLNADRKTIVAVGADGREISVPVPVEGSAPHPAYLRITEGVPEMRGPEGQVIIAAQPPIEIADAQ